MSISLAEIKVKMIERKLLGSTLIERSWPTFEKLSSQPDPKVLNDLVSESLWWVLAVHLTGLPYLSAVFLASSLPKSHAAAHFTLRFWPLPPTLTFLSSFTARQVTGAASATISTAHSLNLPFSMCVEQCLCVGS